MADGGWPIDIASARAAFVPRERLKVVGFAGGGGSSVAIRLATGVDPDLCANHWLTAVLAHQRHFPHTEHACADIFDVDPRAWRAGENIALAWFSPDCTDFSKAKGKAPRSERIRGLAWSVIPWAAFRMVETIMVENVEEILQWGPVHRAGPLKGEPIKARRGETFARWVRRLETLGYVVEWRILNAADYGAPTTRKRLYAIARYVGWLGVLAIKAGDAPSPILWPERTHAPRSKAAALGLKPWRGACEVIDWAEPTPSIFMTAAEIKAQGLRIKRPLVAATERRIARGLERFVMGRAEPYIVHLTHHGSDRTHAVREPLATVTAAHRGELAVCDVAMMTNAYGSNTRGGGDLREPTKTLTGAGHSAVVSGHMVQVTQRGWGGDRSNDIVEPSPTILGSSGGQHALVAASLQRQFGHSTGQGLAEPAAAVMPGGGGKTAMLSAFLGRQFGSTVSGRDIPEPAPTIMSDGAGGKASVVAAHLGSYYATGIGSDPVDPMPAATAQGRHALTLAHMEQANTGMTGHEMRAPLSTIVGRGTTQRLVEYALELEGGAPGRRAQVLAFLWSHFGEPTEAEFAAPASSLATRLKFGLVILGGAVWMIVDIGLRMLKPSELAAAMGLPDGYDLSVDAQGRAVSKTNQIQMIGNMVSPPPAEALIRANCPDLAAPERIAA